MKKFPMILLLFLITVTGVHAMGIRYHYQILCWSQDSSRVLILIVQTGPEGGYRYDYGLISMTDGRMELFPVQDNLGTGSGTLTERVTPGMFAAAIRRLKLTLKNSGFKGIRLKTVRPRGLDNTLHEITDEENFRVSRGIFNKKPGFYENGALTLAFQDENIGLYENKARRILVKSLLGGSSSDSRILGWVSPDRKSVLIVEEIRYDSQVFNGLIRLETAQARFLPLSR